MAFNSIIFGAFFAVFILIYYRLPGKSQLYWILLSSCIFYAYTVPYYIILVFITIAVDFFITRKIAAEPNRKKIFLFISLFVNIAILFSFKYLDFTITNVNHIAKLIGWNYSAHYLNIVLPIGLSFFIFKSMSHVIDSYRGNVKIDANFIEYASYILFFPEILSGPIDRSRNLLPQLKAHHEFDPPRFAYGLKLFAWGLFKKAVIADRLAIPVNHVYSSLQSYHGTELLITVLFYSFQIYCDFSGYSDMAIGCGKMMGFDLQLNFNMPYLSRSVADFWRRWHITLSSWFRDYVFLPVFYGSFRKFIGKNKPHLKGQVSAYIIAVLVTMFLVGLWHGANWTFVAWGTYLGLLMIISQLTKNIRTAIKKGLGLSANMKPVRIMQVAITFSLISLSWIFFRAATLNDAFYIFKNMFSGLSLSLDENVFGIYDMQITISFVLIAFIFIIESFLKDGENPVDLIARRSRPLRWAFYYAIFLLTLCFGEFGARTFVYFKF